MKAYAVHYDHKGTHCVDVICENCWADPQTREEYAHWPFEPADFERYSEPADRRVWVGVGDNGDAMWERVRELTCQLCGEVIETNE